MTKTKQILVAKKRTSHEHDKLQLSTIAARKNKTSSWKYPKNCAAKIIATNTQQLARPITENKVSSKNVENVTESEESNGVYDENMTTTGSDSHEEEDDKVVGKGETVEVEVEDVFEKEEDEFYPYKPEWETGLVKKYKEEVYVYAPEWEEHGMGEEYEDELYEYSAKEIKKTRNYKENEVYEYEPEWEDGVEKY